MDFVQIGNLVPEYLTNDATKQWLENVDDEEFKNFVQVNDGDVSIARDVETTIYTLDDLLSSEHTGECYIRVDTTSDEEKTIVDKLLSTGRWENSNHSQLSGTYLRPINPE